MWIKNFSTIPCQEFIMAMHGQIQLFFERLDEELEKVNKFYEARETEFLERGEILNRQLQILVDLKPVLSDRRRKLSPRSSSGFLSRSYSSSTRNSDFSGEFYAFSLVFFFF